MWNKLDMHVSGNYSAATTLWQQASDRLVEAANNAAEDPDAIIDLAAAIPQVSIGVAIAAKLLRTDAEMSKQLLDILA